MFLISLGFAGSSTPPLNHDHLKSRVFITGLRVALLSLFIRTWGTTSFSYASLCLYLDAHIRVISPELL